MLRALKPEMLQASCFRSLQEVACMREHANARLACKGCLTEAASYLTVAGRCQLASVRRALHVPSTTQCRSLSGRSHG